MQRVGAAWRRLQEEHTIKPWIFVHTGDIHFASPRSYRYWPHVNENWKTACGQIISIGPDLLLNCGDLGFEGWIHPDELKRLKANLNGLPFPCHAVAGNMDVGNKTAKYNGGTAEGWNDIEHSVSSRLLARFESTFGPCNWSFVHTVFCGHVHHNRVRHAEGIRFETCTGTAFKKGHPPDCNNDLGFPVLQSERQWHRVALCAPCERVDSQGLWPRGTRSASRLLAGLGKALLRGRLAG